MKRIFIFLVCLAPIFSFSQTPDTINLGLGSPQLWGFKDTGVDTSAHMVSLPPLWKSELYKTLHMGKYGTYQYVISEDSMYYKAFARFSKDSLPVFDFSKKELFAKISCHYCSSLGTMDNGEPRHRNACQYTAFWFVRNKR
jgi:hypothetical protein